MQMIIHEAGIQDAVTHFPDIPAMPLVTASACLSHPWWRGIRNKLDKTNLKISRTTSSASYINQYLSSPMELYEPIHHELTCPMPPTIFCKDCWLNLREPILKVSTGLCQAGLECHRHP